VKGSELSFEMPYGRQSMCLEILRYSYCIEHRCILWRNVHLHLKVLIWRKPVLWFLSQNLLFSPSKPFSRGQNYILHDIDLMIDCFVSCFRIKPHNNEALKVCLNPNSSFLYHYVLISSLYRYDIFAVYWICWLKQVTPLTFERCLVWWPRNWLALFRFS
jgi:hypothetical protein